MLTLLICREQKKPHQIIDEASYSRAGAVLRQSKGQADGVIE